MRDVLWYIYEMAIEPLIVNLLLLGMCYDTLFARRLDVLLSNRGLDP